MSVNAPPKSIHVLTAIAALLLLAGGLAVRLQAGIPQAPEATVPPPRPAAIGELDIPCWSCRKSLDWPIRSRTDLDLLAPLGTGDGNAGKFFAQFAKVSGPRASDAAKARERLVEGPANLGQVLPPDDPLLLEAEPWCDQGTLTFYPETLALDGYETEITDLLLPLTFAKSWVARGRQSDDSRAALDDYRRAVRLGRLLRQEDVLVISDLIGMAVIRIGSQAIFEHARDQGNLELALVASIVLGELGPQRLLTSERITRVDLAPQIKKSETLLLPEGKLDALIALAVSAPERRFRGEGILHLGVVAHLGIAEQGAKARATLVELSASKDPIVAHLASWSLTHAPTAELIEELKKGAV